MTHCFSLPFGYKTYALFHFFKSIFFFNYQLLTALSTTNLSITKYYTLKYTILGTTNKQNGHYCEKGKVH